MSTATKTDLLATFSNERDGILSYVFKSNHSKWSKTPYGAFLMDTDANEIVDGRYYPTFEQAIENAQKWVKIN